MQTLFPEPKTGGVPDEAPTAPETAEPQQQPAQGERPRLEPTRYGDWEKAGRCIDF
ncbi:MAG TPA: DUF1674 domain-containing protein [Methylococcaceae bacterium]|nr:DUF1674 domain-containing protein [Methylococcaceae bacterium]